MDHYQTSTDMDDILVSLEKLNNQYVLLETHLQTVKSLASAKIASDNKFLQISTESLTDILGFDLAGSELSTEGLIDIVGALFTFIGKLFKALINFITRNASVATKKAESIKPASVVSGSETDDKVEKLKKGEAQLFIVPDKITKKYRKASGAQVKKDSITISPVILTDVLRDIYEDGIGAGNYVEKYYTTLTDFGGEVEGNATAVELYTTNTLSALDAASDYLSTLYDKRNGQTQLDPVMVWGDALAVFPLLDTSVVGKTGVTVGNPVGGTIPNGFGKYPHLLRKDSSATADYSTRYGVIPKDLRYTVTTDKKEIADFVDTVKAGQASSKLIEKARKSVAGTGGLLKDIQKRINKIQDTVNNYEAFGFTILLSKGTINSNTDLKAYVDNDKHLKKKGVTSADVPDMFYDNYVNNSATQSIISDARIAADLLGKSFSNNRTVYAGKVQTGMKYLSIGAKTVFNKKGVLDVQLQFIQMVNDVVSNAIDPSNELKYTPPSLDNENYEDMSFEALTASVESSTLFVHTDLRLLEQCHNNNIVPSHESIAILTHNAIKQNNKDMVRILNSQLSVEIIGTIVAGMLLGILLLIASIFIRALFLLRRVKGRWADFKTPDFDFSEGGTRTGPTTPPPIPFPDSFACLYGDVKDPELLGIRKRMGGGSTNGVITIAPRRANKIRRDEFPITYQRIQSGDIKARKLGYIHVNNKITGSEVNPNMYDGHAGKYIVKVADELIPAILSTYSNYKTGNMERWAKHIDNIVTRIINMEPEGAMREYYNPGTRTEFPFVNGLIKGIKIAESDGIIKVLASNKIWPTELKRVDTTHKYSSMDSNVVELIKGEIVPALEETSKLADKYTAIDEEIAATFSKDKATKIADVLRVMGEALDLFKAILSDYDGNTEETKNGPNGEFIHFSKYYEAAQNNVTIVDVGLVDKYVNALRAGAMASGTTSTLTPQQLSDIITFVQEDIDILSKWIKEFESIAKVYFTIRVTLSLKALNHIGEMASNPQSGLMTTYNMYFKIYELLSKSTNILEHTT